MWQFANEHPIVALLMVLVVCNTVRMLFDSACRWRWWRDRQ